jgi:Flp pilus assembly protein TadD
MKILFAGLAALMLAGCASDGSAPWLVNMKATSCAKPSPDQELTLNLAQGMADEGRLHASLANLESMPDSLGEVRLRKARVLRLLGSNEAEPLYKSLLGTCRAAEGEHGLGQLAAARGNNDQALEHLLNAVRLAPTDEKMRNDLGVVYLNQLKLDQARFQFLTAIELKQSDSLAALNLVTLLIYQDNWKQAAELVSRTGLSPQQVSDAQARALQLKGSLTSKAEPAAPVERYTAATESPNPPKPSGSLP